jgi:RIO kinase 1
MSSSFPQPNKNALTALLAGDVTDDDFADWLSPGLPRGASARQPARKPGRTDHEVVDEIAHYAGHESAQEMMGAESLFRPSFTGSRYERTWILRYLGHFYEDRQISDVLRQVKGGKEATVYCCAAHPGTGLELLAAKIYRPRAFRQLRNDARYRQGRHLLDERGKVVRDGGLLTAVRKKTAVGKEAEHISWLEHEYQTLERLAAAGADVPRPIARANSTILMEYVGSLEQAAPSLSQVRLERGEAHRLFERLMANVEIMLSQQIIHGDLSAYNVLYWQGAIKVIDFPQAVQPQENPEAYDILRRDVTRLCQYFARQGIRSDPAAIVDRLWARYGTTPRAVLDTTLAAADQAVES